MAIPENLVDLLEGTALAHIATIGPNGEPHSSPVWFGWDGQYIRFTQTKNRQKYRNIQRDSRVALSIVDPNNRYRYLEVRGKVVRIEEDPEHRYIDSMAKKYENQDVWPGHQPNQEWIIMVIEPERTTSIQ